MGVGRWVDGANPAYELRATLQMISGKEGQREHWPLDSRNAKFMQILKGAVVVTGGASQVVLTTLRNDNNHPLSCPGQKHAVSVLQIRTPLFFVDSIPASSLELMV